MRRASRATAPEEIQDLLQNEGSVASDDPLAREFGQLFTTVQTLSQPTQRHLVQLWQGTLALVQGSNDLPTRPSAAQARDAGTEHYATTPYY